MTWAHTETPLCACTNIIHVHTLTQVSENVQRGISKVIPIKGKMRLQNEGENNILKTVLWVLSTKTSLIWKLFSWDLRNIEYIHRPGSKQHNAYEELICILQSTRFEWIKFPLIIYFPYGNVSVSVLVFQFVARSHSRTVSTSLFTVSASPLLPCTWVHHTIFLDSVYMP